MNIQFKQWKCEIQFDRYMNGRTAILLVNAEDGSPIATASVNLPEVDMADNEIAIKDYSENEGMLQTMIDAAVVSEPLRLETSGFVTIPICRLLVKSETYQTTGGSNCMK